MANPTCAERIKDELQERMVMVKEAHENDEKREELLGLVLECQRSLVFTVTLSTGGPADGFRFFVDPEERKITRAWFWYSDWWDHAEVELQGQEFDVAAAVFAWVAELET